MPKKAELTTLKLLDHYQRRVNDRLTTVSGWALVAQTANQEIKLTELAFLTSFMGRISWLLKYRKDKPN